MAEFDVPGAATPVPKDLVGKVAIVTGSSRGIGRAIALQLAQRGAKIVVTYVSNEKEAQRVLQEIGSDNGIVVQADVAQKDAAKKVFDAAHDKYNKVDILVNNAGWMDSSYAKIADTSDEVLDKSIDINLKGSFYMLREAANRLQNGGRIVNITSTLVVFNNVGYGVAAYAGAKAAIETITRCMVHELRGKRITVNVVAPGPTGTDLFFQGKTDEMVQRLVKMNPLERLGQPEDIAFVVGFLCSPQGEWVNGQLIRPNGGYA